MRTIADTTAGTVRGTEIADGIVGWRGIPYAAPPVGPLRLRPPQPPVPWPGVRDATAYGNRSLQTDLDVPGFGAAAPQPEAPASEDCLYLNVTAPAGAARRPVLVWLHGGGYALGSGPMPAGDGAAFARSHGVLVVTLNYRLGALGYLDLEGEEATGAYGTCDQIAALRWVHENIAGFGGDPGQVTVYGLSAGAKSVTNLIASPLTRGLITRAASSSGGEYVKNARQAAALTRRFLHELGTTAGKIRDVPAADILAAQDAIGSGIRATWIWRPSIDGYAIPRSPTEAIAAGAAAGIPLLVQTCGNECGLYEVIAPDAAGQADRVLDGYFGRQARERLERAYAASRPEFAADPTRLRTALMTDERYGIPSTRLADAQSAHAPVWRSRYDGPVSGMPDPLPESLAGIARQLRATHASDGSAVFQGEDGLAGQVHAVWGAFITGQDPAAAGLPAWPRYDPGARATMIFDPDDLRVENDPHGAERAAWDGLQWSPGPWWHFDGVA
jgi:para-nitrobenzyl esterase